MDQTVEVMIQILKEFQPSILLIGDIPYAREMGGRLAYRLKGSFIPDCIDLALDEELTLTGIRFLDGKKASMKSSGQATSYQIASVRGGIFSQQKDLFNKQCEVIKTQTPPLPKKRYEERIDYRKVDPLTLDISEAEVILAGGRGMKDVSHFRLLEELGKLLGGTVGCSRAVVDQGWLPKTKQIGQSGKTVAPKFYLASGISGASQHVLGMKDSQHIVAINKDEYAPIFKMADLGLVGDLFEILPLLIEALKKEK
jgi:electron transfer flavoprotein alpha subunit